MKIFGIYQIGSRCKPERFYIGSAVNIERRWKEHLYKLRLNKHDNSKLQNHYNKYGKNDLVFSIIIGCAKEDLINTEQFYIDSRKTWFNICHKTGSTYGVKHTEAAKDKNRKAHLGLKHTKEHNDKIAKAQEGEKNSFFNKKHTEESNQKRREWNLAHPPHTRIPQKTSGNPQTNVRKKETSNNKFKLKDAINRDRY